LMIDANCRCHGIEQPKEEKEMIRGQFSKIEAYSDLGH
jgi:hypothetical protein